MVTVPKKKSGGRNSIKVSFTCYTFEQEQGHFHAEGGVKALKDKTPLLGAFTGVGDDWDQITAT